MIADLLAPKLLFIYYCIAAALYTHHRGNVRHRPFRQLSDHSTFMAPVNAIMYLFSKVPCTPYINTSHFPELKMLDANWEVIRDEALMLYKQQHIKSSDKLNDIGFNSFFKSGWKRFYLKWYGDELPSAATLCPATVHFLKQIPNIKAAMFAMLPPGSRLVRHRDPYAGSLRYHLGLITPNHEQCFINVDGETYYWKDGESVMFDETYIHFAENSTDTDRIILFCDVERPLNNPLAGVFNRAFSRLVMAASATKNLDGDRVGGLNRAFQYIYQIRLLGKRIKNYNRTLYYTLKWMLFLSLLYAIFG
ncbi:aspartyl/asparaginyl beta-hydroxylase domain-containing protein [Endozoicomonas atrinae]|uniref:aspartyl/asparaginyl beta-hydroxylase domain-containing protein n=1 Tax=Endozoicomonas atrinae TaxID=1333660 RepID=UPI003B007266